MIAYVINASKGPHNKVQQLIRQLEEAPFVETIDTDTGCGCRHTGDDCDEFTPSIGQLLGMDPYGE